MTTGLIKKIYHNWDEFNIPVTSVNWNTGPVTVSEFTPGEGTTGQVLMKTADWYTWQNAPATGIVNITTGTTSTLTWLWVWTQAEYDALSSYSDTVAYLVF